LDITYEAIFAIIEKRWDRNSRLPKRGLSHIPIENQFIKSQLN